MSKHIDYTVGWVCGDATDHIAAQVLLDERHDNPEFIDSYDNNQYIFGRMGQHNVIFAAPVFEDSVGCVPRVVLNMAKSFPDLKLCLMVGTGGGVPSDSNDVRLGDVVVGTGSTFGGLIQYDMNASMGDETLHPTAHQVQSPGILLNAIITPKNSDEIDSSRIVDTIREKLQSRPAVWSQFQKPDPFSDTLYRSSVTHNDQNKDCKTGCDDDPSSQIMRLSRFEANDPTVHYGAIASSSQFMANAMLRDKIGLQNSILCFETAAAGLMNNLPCLVVRGICDYADSHRSITWKRYAAINAAAYTKDLLSNISAEKVAMESRTIENMVNSYFRPSTQSNTSQTLQYRGKSSRKDSNPSNRPPTTAENPGHRPIINSRTVVAQQQQLRHSAHYIQEGGQSTIRDAAADETFTYSVNKSSATSARLGSYITRFIFHQYTLVSALLAFGVVSGMMIMAAVKQTREPACIPHRSTLSSDDGFWVLLAQLFLQMLAIFCTVYPVVLNHDLKDSVRIFWFVSLLVISFLATITALVVYAWNWAAAIMLTFVATFTQIIPAALLASSLDPRNTEKNVIRRATLKLEGRHQD